MYIIKGHDSHGRVANGHIRNYIMLLLLLLLLLHRGTSYIIIRRTLTGHIGR